MKVLTKTYSSMTLLLNGHIDENGHVHQANVCTPIQFDGIDTLSDIYDQRFKQPEGETITYTIAGRKLVFAYEHGMQLWDIADQLFWEYQDLANPEIAELMHLERNGQRARPTLSLVS